MGKAIRILQFVLCAASLLMTMAFVSGEGKIGMTILIFVAAFTLITFIGVISLSQGRPMVWTACVMFCTAGFLVFCLCAGLAMFTEQELSSTVLILCSVLYLITAIVFLMEVLAILIDTASFTKQNMLCRACNRFRTAFVPAARCSVAPLSSTARSDTVSVKTTPKTACAATTSYGGTFYCSRDTPPLPGPRSEVTIDIPQEEICCEPYFLPATKNSPQLCGDFCLPTNSVCSPRPPPAIAHQYYQNPCCCCGKTHYSQVTSVVGTLKDCCPLPNDACIDGPKPITGPPYTCSPVFQCLSPPSCNVCDIPKGGNISPCPPCDPCEPCDPCAYPCNLPCTSCPPPQIFQEPYTPCQSCQDADYSLCHGCCKRNGLDDDEKKYRTRKDMDSVEPTSRETSKISRHTVEEKSSKQKRSKKIPLSVLKGKVDEQFKQKKHYKKAATDRTDNRLIHKQESKRKDVNREVCTSEPVTCRSDCPSKQYDQDYSLDQDSKPYCDNFKMVYQARCDTGRELATKNTEIIKTPTIPTYNLVETEQKFESDRTNRRLTTTLYKSCRTYKCEGKTRSNIRNDVLYQQTILDLSRSSDSSYKFTRSSTSKLRGAKRELLLKEDTVPKD